jgi:hypothetical protein
MHSLLLVISTLTVQLCCSRGVALVVCHLLDTKACLRDW